MTEILSKRGMVTLMGRSESSGRVPLRPRLSWRPGAAGQGLLLGELSKAMMCGQFCDIIGRGVTEYGRTRSLLPSPS